MGLLAEVRLAGACEAGLRARLGRARQAQARWREIPVAERVKLIRDFRHLLADETSAVLRAVQQARGVSAAEILVSEIVPLADAGKFLEDEAEEILATEEPKGRRPFWLAGTELKIRREPLGVVLIIAPSNYPLFIAGVQVLQALVAGNAVVVKPGRGAGLVMQAMCGLLFKAGLDRELLTVLDDEDEAGVRSAIAEGVDKILLTGSSRTGVAVLEEAARSLTPAVMELSGCDAAFVLAGADAALAAKALAFGLLLNRSRTCMRPHRVLVHKSLRDELVRHLECELGRANFSGEMGRLDLKTQRMLADAGARVVMGSPEDPFGFPMVLEGVDPRAELGQTDGFLPILILYSFGDSEEALRIYDECPYALGASVFGPEERAEELAERIDAGFVTINDVIAPTADPRLPFAGRKRSGFGTTRGAEGLLELTRVKAVATRRSNYKHLEERRPEDAEFFAAYLQMAHGAGLRRRFEGAVKLVRLGMKRGKANL
jgi:acyl-CoA reductase-like NAD-dependent aldehyde dehydrogenase